MIRDGMVVRYCGYDITIELRDPSEMFGDSGYFERSKYKIRIDVSLNTN